MGFRRNNFLLLVLSVLIVSRLIGAQVVFRELPDYKPLLSDRSFFEITQTRSVIPLNGEWSVYPAGEYPSNKVRVKVPSVFEGEGELVFEKGFTLSREVLQNNSYELVFLGLNYRADISVNNIMIFRHAGGEFPFRVDLSRDILKADSVNIITVRLYYRLDSKNTIPLKQRFLFPKNFGGLIHDVYIYSKPNINFSNIDIETKLDFKKDEASIHLLSSVVNQEHLTEESVTPVSTNLSIKIIISDAQSNIVYTSDPVDFELMRNKEKTIEHTIKLKEPVLWSPDNPQSYEIKLELNSSGELLDVMEKQLAIYSFTSTDDNLLLNGIPFKLKGVTYIPEFLTFGDLMSYNQFETDIKLIKQAGFNAVRIAKMVPHPYVLKLCEKYGLLTFIELPVAMVPENLSHDQNFAIRCKYFLSSYIQEYKKYSSVAAIGLGGTFLNSIDSHRALLTILAAFVKEQSNWITYASFGDFDIQKINNLDLYGIELVNELPAEHIYEFNKAKDNLGSGRLLISEATYTVNIGSTDGYINKYSYEAQAKYFSDLIDFSNETAFAGYFINTMFDMRGDYSSLLSGYNDENIYNIGLAEENRSTNRLGFKVVSSKLNQAERVTIPIGSPKDDSPMVFILFGLILAVLMGVLVNSGRKFREDASRALLRPYNFYADVRDQRIMSAYHTTFLALIIVSVIALVSSNILFFLRTDIIFEKLLLSFGSPLLIKVINYLCWFPFNSIVWLLIIGIITLLLLTFIIKTASLFIKSKVYLSSIYFMVIWAMLPLVFLIPLGIVLYRVLIAEMVNVYIYLLLIIFGFWVLHRMLKGIYVLFDANPGNVYFYSTLFLLLLIGGVMFYFEIKHSTIQYILFTLNQYNII